MINEKSSLDLYLKKISRIPLLPRSEEIELAQKAQSGDKAAKKKLIESNLRFVVTVAKRYQNCGLQLEDLRNEGNIGLMIAADRFDSSWDNRFITYASCWIIQSILKAIGKTSRAIRLPVNWERDISRIKRAEKGLPGTMSESRKIEEICRMLNLAPAHVCELLALSREMVSMDSPNKDNLSTLGDIIMDECSTTPEDAAIRECLKEDINRAFKTLKPKEEKILRLRLGFDGGNGMSLDEIGKVFNRSKERIRQIEENALDRLRLLPYMRD